MKAKLIKVDGVYRLYETIKHGNSIIGTTDLDYQKTWSDICQKLSLKNCQAIERGYDLDELAENIKTEDGFAHRQSFIVGFQKALELMGDKKFTEQDIHEAYFLGERDDRGGLHDILKSQEQHEWDVEIEMEEKCRPMPMIHQKYYEPKLDADWCLILKPKL